MIPCSYRLLVIGFIVSFDVGCQSATPGTTVTVDDYRVYSAFLDTFTFYRNVPSKEAIFILDSTAINLTDIHPQTPWNWVVTHLGDRCHRDNDEVRCRKEQDPAWIPLFDALKQPVTHKPRALQQQFTARYPTSVFTKSQLVNYYHDASGSFYVLGLSNIVYNPDHTKALFFSSFVCGSKCGRGELVMLEKTDQTWTLIDTFRFWIA